MKKRDVPAQLDLVSEPKHELTKGPERSKNPTPIPGRVFRGPVRAESKGEVQGSSCVETKEGSKRVYTDTRDPIPRNPSNDAFMTLRVERNGPGKADEAYIDFNYPYAGWRGPYPLDTSIYDLMIIRMRKFSHWNEHGVGSDPRRVDSSESSSDAKEEEGSEDDDESSSSDSSSSSGDEAVEGDEDDLEEDTSGDEGPGDQPGDQAGEGGTSDGSDEGEFSRSNSDGKEYWTECWPSTGDRKGNPKRD